MPPLGEMDPAASGQLPAPPIRTLIVDDSESVRNLMRAFLKEGSPIRVVGSAVDGGDALRQILELKPDLVLMDLDMPVMNGVEATRQIKQLPHAPRVIVVTLAPPALVKAALKAGADAYCEKHRLHETLGDRIRALFPEARTS